MNKIIKLEPVKLEDVTQKELQDRAKATMSTPEMVLERLKQTGAYRKPDGGITSCNTGAIHTGNYPKVFKWAARRGNGIGGIRPSTETEKKYYR